MAPPIAREARRANTARVRSNRSRGSPGSAPTTAPEASDDKGDDSAKQKASAKPVCTFGSGRDAAESADEDESDSTPDGKGPATSLSASGGTT